MSSDIDTLHSFSIVSLLDTVVNAPDRRMSGPEFNSQAETSFKAFFNGEGAGVGGRACICNLLDKINYENFAIPYSNCIFFKINDWGNHVLLTYHTKLRQSYHRIFFFCIILTCKLYIGLENQIFQCKIVNIFLQIIFSICLECSNKPSHRGGSFVYQQHIFWLRNKKIIFLLHTLKL